VAAKEGENSFGRKLGWLKLAFRVSDREIGAAAGASDSLVCRWRNGERALDRHRDEGRLRRLAGFFARRAIQTGQERILAQALSLSEADVKADGAKRDFALIHFLFSEGGGLPGAKPKPSENEPLAQEPFFGLPGLLAALRLLESRVQGAEAAMSVYCSLEHSRLLRDPGSEKLWEALWRIGGENPVNLFFDRWTDAGQAMKTLRRLLPFMQSGRLRLHLIKSSQKLFYSNASFYADGVGVVVAAEPVSGFGESVSMLVDSPDYVQGMGSVLARFGANSKRLEKHLGGRGTKEEAAHFSRLFDPSGDLRAIVDGASLLYLDSGAYMSLLKLNGVAGSQRAYRLERFSQGKRRFEAFLETGQVTEIYSLPSFDQIILTYELRTPDFSFYKGAIKVNKYILTSLLAGIIEYFERRQNLSIFLHRSGLPNPDFSCRQKGDSFVLLHYFGGGQAHAAWSDAWLLVYEYIRQFNDLLEDGDLITAREAVLAALRLRLEMARAAKSIPRI
jgi:hypothetical protein